MQNKLIELLKVKSLVTLMVMFVFCYLSVIKIIEPKEFMIIAGMIITYYFSKDKN